MVLKIQAFGGGISREQDAHRADLRSRLESGFDLFPLPEVHATYIVSVRSPPVSPCWGENFLEPVLRGPVFGEQDDPLVAPFLAGSNVRVEPFDQALRLGVRADPRPFAPTASFGKEYKFVRVRFAEEHRGGVNGIGRGFVVLSVVSVVLINPGELLLQDSQ